MPDDRDGILDKFSAGSQQQNSQSFSQFDFSSSPSGMLRMPGEPSMSSPSDSDDVIANQLNDSVEPHSVPNQSQQQRRSQSQPQNSSNEIKLDQNCSMAMNISASDTVAGGGGGGTTSFVSNYIGIDAQYSMAGANGGGGSSLNGTANCSGSLLDFMITEGGGANGGASGGSGNLCYGGDVSFSSDMINHPMMSMSGSSAEQQMFEVNAIRHQMMIQQQQQQQQQHQQLHSHVAQSNPMMSGGPPCYVSAANVRGDRQMIPGGGGISPATYGTSSLPAPVVSYQQHHHHPNGPSFADIYNPANHGGRQQCFVNASLGESAVLVTQPPVPADQSHLRCGPPESRPPQPPHSQGPGGSSQSVMSSPRLVAPPPLSGPPLLRPPPHHHHHHHQNKDNVVQLHPSGQYILPFARHHLPQYPRHVMTAQQNMLINTVNLNAPPVLLCGVCRQPADGDPQDSILCEGGCDFFYHRECVGLDKEAAAALKSERYAIWVCDNCHRDKQIPSMLLRRRD